MVTSWANCSKNSLSISGCVITSRSFRRYHTSLLYKGAESDGTFPNLLMSCSWTNWVSTIVSTYIIYLQFKAGSSPLIVWLDPQHQQTTACHWCPRSGKLQQDKLKSKGNTYTHMCQYVSIRFSACCCHPFRAHIENSVQAFKPVGEPMRLRYLADEAILDIIFVTF